MKILQDKTYYENYAKDRLIQIGLFVEGDLTKCERPDWININKDIGIEVVRAVYRNEEKGTRFVVRVKEEEKRMPTERESTRFSRLGGNIYGNEVSEIRASFGWTPRGYDELIKNIKHKTENLNKEGFRRFQTNALYVFAEWHALEENDIITIIRSIKGQSEKYKFDIIYLDGSHEIWICDTRTETYEKRSLE